MLAARVGRARFGPADLAPLPAVQVRVNVYRSPVRIFAGTVVPPCEDSGLSCQSLAVKISMERYTFYT